MTGTNGQYKHTCVDGHIFIFNAELVGLYNLRQTTFTDVSVWTSNCCWAAESDTWTARQDYRSGKTSGAGGLWCDNLRTSVTGPFRGSFAVRRQRRVIARPCMLLARLTAPVTARRVRIDVWVHCQSAIPLSKLRTGSRRIPQSFIHSSIHSELISDTRCIDKSNQQEQKNYKLQNYTNYTRGGA